MHIGIIHLMEQNEVVSILKHIHTQEKEHTLLKLQTVIHTAYTFQLSQCVILMQVNIFMHLK